MLRKKKSLILIILIVLIFAITIKTIFILNRKEDEDKYVTKEYIMERYQITEEDIKGLYVEEILKRYPSTDTLAYLDYINALTVINITDDGKRKIINALKEANLEEWKQKCEVKEI